MSNLVNAPSTVKSLGPNMNTAPLIILEPPEIGGEILHLSRKLPYYWNKQNTKEDHFEGKWEIGPQSN